MTPQSTPQFNIPCQAPQCERGEFEPFSEPVAVYHMGGAQNVAVRTGRHWGQRTHPGRITIMPPDTGVAWDIRGEVYSRSVHLRSRFLDRTAEDGGASTPEPRFRCGIEDPMIAVLVESLEKHLRSPSESGTLYADALRKTTGKATHQHLTRIRLEYARALLAKSSISISDMAFRCGFSSQAHLTTAFRKAFGQPPRRYRLGA